MTQIYTANTVLVQAKAPIVNFIEGDSATMVADINIIWINTNAAQRFLTYKWQESNNGGSSWRDISTGISDHPLSLNNTTPTKTVSLLDNQLQDLQLSEFNIARTKPISASLTINNVLISQNNYIYRCVALLYNNDINTIESVGSTENIILNVKNKNTGHILPNFDIPWDPMNPRGIIKSGNLSFDQNTKIEIFKLTKDACGSQWRIIETGYNSQYLSGNITNGIPVGLPSSYGPNNQSYPGYMELQFYCDNNWVTQEAWTSLEGNDDHTFATYGSISPVTVAINGKTVISSTSLGGMTSPLVINPSPVGLGDNSITVAGASSSDQQTIAWDGTALGYAYSMGIIPESFQTITIPSTFSLPVQVTITGGADDDLVVDGTRVTFRNGAGELTYTFVANNRTFTVGVYNAICCGSGYSYTISFVGNKTNSAIGSVLRADSTNILAISQASESKTITVNGNSNDWVNTGISLKDTSRLQISSSGSIQWSTNNFSGPSGVGSGNNILYSGIPQSALVGRIGTTGTPFYISDYYNSFANATGVLYLSVNDNTKWDNSGSFVSKINYASPDPIGVRVTTANTEAYDPTTQDIDFDKVTLLVKSDADSTDDLSINSRSFTNTNVKLGSEISKNGGYSSYYGDGGYSVATSNSSLGFSGDFTIEGWFYFDKNNVGYQGLVSTYRTGDISGWLLILESNNTLRFYATNASVYWYWPVTISSNYVPPTNQWIHIVVQRLNSNLKMFANGVEVGSTTNNATDITSGYIIELGGYQYFPGGRKTLQGYIDEIRITKGLARYPQGNPPAPTKPFPKLGYSSVKYIDLSTSQKSATPIYDSTNQNILYYEFNSKNSYIGPYNQPGQISLVYSYTNGTRSSAQAVNEGYFQAFDGSNRFFRKLGLYDLDCCYQGSQRPDDGYYVVKKRADGQCVVVDSARWYAANGYAVGKIVPCISVPASMGHPNDSATWRSWGYGGNCCNADGTKNYYELTDEVLTPITPTPTVSPSSLTPTPTPTNTRTPTPTQTVTPSVTTSSLPPSYEDLYRDVVLLLNMSGTNGSKNIIDSSLVNNTIVATGSAALSTTQSRFGGSSLLIPAATSSKNAIYLSSSNDFNFGSNNFTIDFWLRQNDTPQSGARVFQTTENNDTTSGIDIYYPTNVNSLVAKVSDSTGNNVLLSLGATNTDLWNHYGLVRNNNVITTYRNGIQVASQTKVINVANSSDNIVIGGNATVGNNRSINAYIDDFRITKATRYSSNFTPPAFQAVNAGPPVSPTPTITPSITATQTSTPTLTPSSGFIPSPTPTATVTPTFTRTPSATTVFASVSLFNNIGTITGGGTNSLTFSNVSRVLFSIGSAANITISNTTGSQLYINGPNQPGFIYDDYNGLYFAYPNSGQTISLIAGSYYFGKQAGGQFTGTATLS